MRPVCLLAARRLHLYTLDFLSRSLGLVIYLGKLQYRQHQGNWQNSIRPNSMSKYISLHHDGRASYYTHACLSKYWNCSFLFERSHVLPLPCVFILFPSVLSGMIFKRHAIRRRVTTYTTLLIFPIRTPPPFSRLAGGGKGQ